MNSRTSRRTFLGGATALIGLPFMDSLHGRRAQAADCTFAQRFVAVFNPNGFHMPDWTPTTTGTAWELPYLLQPLEPVRSKIAVLSGLDFTGTARGAGAHASGTGPFLTMQPVSSSNLNRISLDQRIAQDSAICARPLPFLNLSTRREFAGECDGAPNCGFLDNISWRDDQVLPAIDVPQEAFDQIFAGADLVASDADADRRAALRASVLDHAMEEATLLRGSLGSVDKLRLDQYMTSIRDLETRIQNIGAALACATPPRPTDNDVPAFAVHYPMMFELAALALTCDATRVLTLMNQNRDTNHNFLTGISGSHHETSHHGGNQGNLDQLREIGRWEVEQFAAFLMALDAVPEANGRTALDNTVVYFASEIADGDAHNKSDLPVILAGSAGGKLKVDGTHHQFTNITFPRALRGPAGGPHPEQVFVSILNAFGIPDQTFGDAVTTGPLPEIVV